MLCWIRDEAGWSRRPPGLAAASACAGIFDWTGQAPRPWPRAPLRFASAHARSWNRGRQWWRHRRVHAGIHSRMPTGRRRAAMSRRRGTSNQLRPARKKVRSGKRRRHRPVRTPRQPALARLPSARRQWRRRAACGGSCAPEYTDPPACGNQCDIHVVDRAAGYVYIPNVLHLFKELSCLECVR